MELEALQQLFTELFSLEPPVDWGSVRYAETEGWDSLAHMQLITELEDLLGILIDTDDVIDLSSFDKAVEILAKYGVVVGV